LCPPPSLFFPNSPVKHLCLTRLCRVSRFSAADVFLFLPLSDASYFFFFFFCFVASLFWRGGNGPKQVSPCRVNRRLPPCAGVWPVLAAELLERNQFGSHRGPPSFFIFFCTFFLISQVGRSLSPPPITRPLRPMFFFGCAVPLYPRFFLKRGFSVVPVSPIFTVLAVGSACARALLPPFTPVFHSHRTSGQQPPRGKCSVFFFVVYPPLPLPHTPPLKLKGDVTNGFIASPFCFPCVPPPPPFFPSFFFPWGRTPNLSFVFAG